MRSMVVCHKPSGTALVLTLILLSALAIVAVASMRSVIFDSKKTHYYRESSVVFNSSQSVVYTAEQYILDKDDPTETDEKNNYYVLSDDIDINAINWKDLTKKGKKEIPNLTDKSPTKEITSNSQLIIYVGEDEIQGENIAEEGYEKSSGKVAEYYYVYGYAQSEEDSRSLVKIIYGKQI